MNESRKKILQMVADKKISADEGEQLLSLLDREETVRNQPGVEAKSAHKDNATSSKRQYTGFRRVEVHSAIDVEMTHGSDYSVEIAPDDCDDIQITQDGETLKIRRPGYFGFGWWGNWGARLKVRITMPELNGVSAHGPSYARVQGFQGENELVMVAIGASRVKIQNVVAGSFRGEVTGASNITGDITAKNEGSLMVSGASHVRLSGTAPKLSLKVYGASHAKMDEFVTTDADVHFSGASHGSFEVNGRLDANLSGASHLHYTGNPVMGNIVTNGASHLNRNPVPPVPPVFR